MTKGQLWIKRGFGLFMALLLSVFFSAFFLGVVIWMLISKDLPIFYISERMRTPTQPFALVKFRTMRPPTESETNTGVSGGDKADRITALGRRRRAARADEVPQLWNVLRGDMSFVGARPPLRRYTEMFPEAYGEVLSTPPGVTGLASLLFHKREALLLASARTPEETEAIYISRCIPPKLRLDRFYLRRRSLRLDLYILYLTAAKLVPLPGRRARRIR